MEVAYCRKQLFVLKSLDCKGLNVFPKDIVVSVSLFYLSVSCVRLLHSFSLKSQHQKWFFYGNRLEAHWKQTNDAVLTVCYLSFTYHFKPIHVIAGCGAIHTMLSIWLLNTFSKADGKSRGKIYVYFMLIVLVGLVARWALQCVFRSDSSKICFGAYVLICEREK